MADLDALRDALAAALAALDDGEPKSARHYNTARREMSPDERKAYDRERAASRKRDARRRNRDTNRDTNRDSNRDEIATNRDISGDSGRAERLATPLPESPPAESGQKRDNRDRRVSHEIATRRNGDVTGNVPTCSHGCAIDKYGNAPDGCHVPHYDETDRPDNTPALMYGDVDRLTDEECAIGKAGVRSVHEALHELGFL